MNFSSRLGVRSAHISTEKSDELDKPVEYSKSKAYTWKAQKTRSGGHLDNYPSYQPYIVSGCLTVFLLYFCVFREENDIDEELGKTLYDRIEGLEERQLQIALKHNLENRQDTSAIVERLKELQKK
ncbi:hypothetical protein B7P43_G04724 [Cryptotermes secundus]|uniref:Uncharacterized protein n=1 Tax=Cryptotermes secundus TaxID=105785 RepID=A0A2J7PKN7_9NEOP|nr:hypothetical protein B7P43_G04724 [Cryptotermes secundus]